MMMMSSDDDDNDDDNDNDDDDDDDDGWLWFIFNTLPTLPIYPDLRLETVTPPPLPLILSSISSLYSQAAPRYLPSDLRR